MLDLHLSDITMRDASRKKDASDPTCADVKALAARGSRNVSPEHDFRRHSDSIQGNVIP
jgi:hypothetical protein